MNTQQGSMKQTIEQAADELYTDSEDNYLLYNEPRINDIRHWQREAFEAGANWMKEQGIHWFSIANGELPPPAKDDFFGKNGWSDKVLITDRTSTTVGIYVHGAEAWSHGSGNWQPTHWAFLNYPE